jgi:tetratricopeptide (TPR) repeat protein
MKTVRLRYRIIASLLAIVLVLVVLVIATNREDQRKAGKGRFVGRLHYWRDIAKGQASVHRQTAEYARKLISTGEAGPTWYRILANWEYEYGSQSEAIELLEKGMAQSSRNSTCYRYLAEILVEQGKAELAIEKCPQWLGKNSNFYRWIARLEGESGQVEKARTHYDLALRLLANEFKTYEENIARGFPLIQKRADAQSSGSVPSHTETKEQDLETALKRLRLQQEETAREIRQAIAALPQ